LSGEGFFLFSRTEDYFFFFLAAFLAFFFFAGIFKIFK